METIPSTVAPQLSVPITSSSPRSSQVFSRSLPRNLISRSPSPAHLFSSSDSPLKENTKHGLVSPTVSVANEGAQIRPDVGLLSNSSEQDFAVNSSDSQGLPTSLPIQPRANSLPSNGEKLFTRRPANKTHLSRAVTEQSNYISDKSGHAKGTAMALSKALPAVSHFDLHVGEGSGGGVAPPIAWREQDATTQRERVQTTSIEADASGIENVLQVGGVEVTGGTGRHLSYNSSNKDSDSQNSFSTSNTSQSKNFPGSKIPLSLFSISNSFKPTEEPHRDPTRPTAASRPTTPPIATAAQAVIVVKDENKARRNDAILQQKLLEAMSMNRKESASGRARGGGGDAVAGGAVMYNFKLWANVSSKKDSIKPEIDDGYMASNPPDVLGLSTAASADHRGDDQGALSPVARSRTGRQSASASGGEPARSDGDGHAPTVAVQAMSWKSTSGLAKRLFRETESTAHKTGSPHVDQGEYVIGHESGHHSAVPRHESHGMALSLRSMVDQAKLSKAVGSAAVSADLRQDVGGRDRDRDTHNTSISAPDDTHHTPPPRPTDGAHRVSSKGSSGQFMVSASSEDGEGDGTQESSLVDDDRDLPRVTMGSDSDCGATGSGDGGSVEEDEELQYMSRKRLERKRSTSPALGQHSDTVTGDRHVGERREEGIAARGQSARRHRLLMERLTGSNVGATAVVEERVRARTLTTGSDSSALAASRSLPLASSRAGTQEGAPYPDKDEHHGRTHVTLPHKRLSTRSKQAPLPDQRDVVEVADSGPPAARRRGHTYDEGGHGKSGRGADCRGSSPRLTRRNVALHSSNTDGVSYRFEREEDCASPVLSELSQNSDELAEAVAAAAQQRHNMQRKLAYSMESSQRTRTMSESAVQVASEVVSKVAVSLSASVAVDLHPPSAIGGGPMPTSLGPSSSAVGHSGDSLSLKWKLGPAIGEGTFSRVYRAMNTSTGEMIALKQLCLTDGSDEEVLELCREIEVMKSLDHGNIVRWGESRVVVELIAPCCLISLILHG